MSLEEMIRLFKQQKFGPKSEKNDRILNQLNLFDEAEYLSEQEVEEAKEDEVVKKPRKKNTGTNLSNVKEVHIQHPLEVCDVCEGPLKQMGEE
ncbi:MAG: transposase domain-containing protein, partial [Serratia sp. (in: enterobacteria)]|uniref:transposase domain-containing protein n=1 Tax=Serratia sp. (in: enterobacteria) TaxID=616 RepID=UPI003F33D1E3